MGNTYYSIRTDSNANMIADVKAALLDTYGAYDDPSNLTGVRFDYDTDSYLIFRCTAISDQYLRIQSSNRRALFSYGDGVSGNDVTNPVRFGGTSSTAAPTRNDLVLGPHTLLYLSQCGLPTLDLIGQLTNDDYAAMGFIGSSDGYFNGGTIAMNTTDGVRFVPITFDGGFQSSAGKMYTQELILAHTAAAGVELNGDGSIASFQDIMNASYITGSSTAVWGATFVLTFCVMYQTGTGPFMRTCLLMTYDAA